MIVKEWFMNGFDWIKTKIMENKLRTGALLCLLLALAGFFLPFMSAKMSASVTGIMTNTLEVISPEYDMINFSLSDFVLQEPIDEFEIYGVPLGNIKVLDQSVLDILRSPLPDKGYVSSINEALASPALDYLVDPQVQQIVITRFNNGEAINGILKDLWNVIQSARNIASQVNDITISARQSMDQVNATMATIDSYKATANGGILILFLVVIGLMALILYKRASIKLSIFISGVLSVLFLGVGIGTAVANNRINEQLSSLASQVNSGIMETLRAILTGTFGDVGTFIANYISGQANFVALAFTLQLEVGYWIILLGLLGALVLLIVLAKKERIIKDETEIEIVLDESALAEEIDEAIEAQNDEQVRVVLDETTKGAAAKDEA
ncbi:hypothetical protein LNN31_01320 [Acetobacterium wieringae]|uniref:ABC transporter permease n=2 Tax=Acetobacterium wieringae TaxID=52694 RepID=A0ABY6HF35_9FIRM|nr:hypothetical protein [Acetobacterium wieringae]MEA4807562.1 hypothetical protein [Acetobacterium wieringae]UYO63119.1 hypothetical protein LNN31_01320 [Acetobacterium wieringae]